MNTKSKLITSRVSKETETLPLASRCTAAVLLLFLTLNSVALIAQESEGSETSTVQTQTTPLKNTRINSGQAQPILRLEDTIRGSKEQPQVLTIVPWQLPVHQRINEDKQWQLQVKPLPLIERNAFLRKLALTKELEDTTVQQ